MLIDWPWRQKLMANIIIVNGAPRSGKDTFVNFCLKELKGFGKSVSTVDFVKESKLNGFVEGY